MIVKSMMICGKRRWAHGRKKQSTAFHSGKAREDRAVREWESISCGRKRKRSVCMAEAKISREKCAETTI